MLEEQASRMIPRDLRRGLTWTKLKAYVPFLLLKMSREEPTLGK